jgi:hypothetical protein
LENVIRDISETQKQLFGLQKSTLEVLRQQQAAIDILHRWTGHITEWLSALSAAVTDEQADSPRPGPNPAALDKARAEIAELEKLFNAKPPEPEA